VIFAQGWGTAVVAYDRTAGWPKILGPYLQMLRRERRRLTRRLIAGSDCNDAVSDSEPLLIVLQSLGHAGFLAQTPEQAAKALH
jgi:hypothetical protein